MTKRTASEAQSPQKKVRGGKLNTAKKSSVSKAVVDKNVKVIFVRLNVEGWRELRKLAAQDDTSIQALMIKSINKLLHEHGRPTVAANPQP